MNLKIYQTGPLDVNTYLLMDDESKEAILIDVGGSFDEIYKEILDKGYTLKYILNTHGHFDHVLGEINIKNKYPNIPIFMHKNDLIHTDKISQEMKMFGLESNIDKFTITSFLDENSDLSIGNNKIKVYHTPGHSGGSVCFYVDNKLFSGDSLFQRSIGRTDFYDGDYDTLINSIKTKLLPLNEDTIVYPGHGPNTTIRAEKKFNIYLK